MFQLIVRAGLARERPAKPAGRIPETCMVVSRNCGRGIKRGLWYPAGKRRLPFAGEARSHKKCFVEALAGQFGVNAVKTSILRHDRE